MNWIQISNMSTIWRKHCYSWPSSWISQQFHRFLQMRTMRKVSIRWGLKCLGEMCLALKKKTNFSNVQLKISIVVFVEMEVTKMYGLKHLYASNEGINALCENLRQIAQSRLEISRDLLILTTYAARFASQVHNIIWIYFCGVQTSNGLTASFNDDIFINEFRFVFFIWTLRMLMSVPGGSLFQHWAVVPDEPSELPRSSVLSAQVVISYACNSSRFGMLVCELLINTNILMNCLSLIHVLLCRAFSVFRILVHCQYFKPFEHSELIKDVIVDYFQRKYKEAVGDFEPSQYWLSKLCT